jgi:hypothetical protein
LVSWSVCAALLGAGLFFGVRPDQPRLLVSAGPTTDLREGDVVTVTVHGVRPGYRISAAQCVETNAASPGMSPADVPGGRADACGPWAHASPNGGSRQQVGVRVRAGQLGSEPGSSCTSPDGGRCVLRVAQAPLPELRPVAARAANGEDPLPPLGGEGQLVQEIVVEVIDPRRPAPPVRPTPPVGPVPPVPPAPPIVLPAPPIRVTPVDPLPRVRGVQVAPAPPAVPAPPAPRELVETGASSTLLLLALGLALLNVGWLARSAVPAPLRPQLR